MIADTRLKDSRSKIEDWTFMHIQTMNRNDFDFDGVSQRGTWSGLREGLLICSTERLEELFEKGAGGKHNTGQREA